MGPWCVCGTPYLCCVLPVTFYLHLCLTPVFAPQFLQAPGTYVLYLLQAGCLWQHQL